MKYKYNTFLIHKTPTTKPKLSFHTMIIPKSNINTQTVALANISCESVRTLVQIFYEYITCVIRNISKFY